jgi:site-specific DNA-methyltransferase (adenine-specific)
MGDKTSLIANLRSLAGRVRLIQGDCREVLPTLRGIDLVATEPPYSSGGTMRSDRNMDTGSKYRLSNVAKGDPDFGGDTRDERSLTLWFSDWMAMCLRATRKGGAMLCFIDWRNLPCAIDAVQVGGWVYRGIVPWDKGEGTRPNKGWFRAQVEYIVTASAGPLTQGHLAPGIVQAVVHPLQRQQRRERAHHRQARRLDARTCFGLATTGRRFWTRLWGPGRRG